MIRKPKRYSIRLVFPWDFHAEWQRTHSFGTSEVHLLWLSCGSSTATGKRVNGEMYLWRAELHTFSGTRVKPVMQTRYWIWPCDGNRMAVSLQLSEIMLYYLVCHRSSFLFDFYYTIHFRINCLGIYWQREWKKNGEKKTFPISWEPRPKAAVTRLCDNRTNGGRANYKANILSVTRALDGCALPIASKKELFDLIAVASGGGMHAEPFGGQIFIQRSNCWEDIKIEKKNIVWRLRLPETRWQSTHALSA